MRHLFIENAHGSARVHVGSWCSAMTAALVLALVPATASAASTQPGADAPQPIAPQPIEPQPIEPQPIDAQPDVTPPDAAPPDAAPPDAAPPAVAAPDPEATAPAEPEPEVTAPEPEVTAPAEPEPEVAQPEPDVATPVAAPPPVVGGPYGVEEDFRAPTPEERAKGNSMRKAGIGLIATGGVVAAGGLGVTLAFTILGDASQNAEEPVLEDIEGHNAMAQVGGILLASGIAIVAVGGIILSRGKKKLEPQPTTARVRVTPALGGLVMRF